jgi:hypothetical protein
VGHVVNKDWIDVVENDANSQGEGGMLGVSVVMKCLFQKHTTASV